MQKHNKRDAAEELRGKLSALVASSATIPPPPTPSAPTPVSVGIVEESGESKIQRPVEAESLKDDFERLGITLFRADFDQINAIMAEGLRRRKKLNQSQAIRLALRVIDPRSVTDEAIEAVRADDKRRKPNDRRLSTRS